MTKVKTDVMTSSFIQSRFSPLPFNRVQEFPWEHWEDKPMLESGINLHLIEWTSKRYPLEENPLFTQRAIDLPGSLVQEHRTNCEKVWA